MLRPGRQSPAIRRASGGNGPTPTTASPARCGLTTGRPAREHAQAAQDIYEDLRLADAEPVRELLRGLDTTLLLEERDGEEVGSKAD